MEIKQLHKDKILICKQLMIKVNLNKKKLYMKMIHNQDLKNQLQ